jgi:membrane-associated phospholipid phosphatase
VHWTSDVVGGWILGVAVVAATAAAFATWRDPVTGRPEAAAPAAPEPGGVADDATG